MYSTRSLIVRFFVGFVLGVATVQLAVRADVNSAELQMYQSTILQMVEANCVATDEEIFGRDSEWKIKC